MKIPELQRKLMAAARDNVPAENVPHAFEARIMALLRTQPPVDLAALWAKALWRAAVPCVAVSLVLGIWSTISSDPAAFGARTSLSQEFEGTVYASIEQQISEGW